MHVTYVPSSAGMSNWRPSSRFHADGHSSRITQDMRLQVPNISSSVGRFVGDHSRF
jgi:hypothetical protein